MADSVPQHLDFDEGTSDVVYPASCGRLDHIEKHYGWVPNAVVRPAPESVELRTRFHLLRGTASNQILFTSMSAVAGQPGQRIKIIVALINHCGYQ
jgi:hypothetical protein